MPGLAKDNQAQSAIVTGCSAWTIYQVLTSMEKIKQITKQTLVPNPGPHSRVNWIRQQLHFFYNWFLIHLQYDNYLGEAACLFPSSTTSCTPGFFPTRSHLARLAGLYPSHVYLGTTVYFRWYYVSPPLASPNNLFQEGFRLWEGAVGPMWDSTQWTKILWQGTPEDQLFYEKLFRQFKTNICHTDSLPFLKSIWDLWWYDMQSNVVLNSFHTLKMPTFI